MELPQSCGKVLVWAIIDCVLSMLSYFYSELLYNISLTTTYKQFSAKLMYLQYHNIGDTNCLVQDCNNTSA